MQSPGRRSVVDVAFQGTLRADPAAASRARTLTKLRLTDNAFRQITRAAAVGVLLILGGVIFSLFEGALPAFRAFGLNFLVQESWNPVTEKFGAFAPIYGTIMTSFIAMAIAVPLGLLITLFLTELCPLWLRRTIGIAIEVLAGIPSIIYGIWGLFVFAPFLQQYVQPALIDIFGHVPVLSSLFAGPPYGIGVLTAGLILAIMVLPFVTWLSRGVFEAVPPVLKEAAYGLGCTTWEVVRYVVLPYTRVGVIGGGIGRAGRARAGRDHGGALRDRQRAPGLLLADRARHHHLGHHRQRVHRSGRRPLHLVADRPRVSLVRDHLHRPRRRPLSAGADRTADRVSPMMDLYARRRLRNRIVMVLAYAATGAGRGWRPGSPAH